MTTRQYEAIGSAVANGAGAASVLFGCPGPPTQRLIMNTIVVLVTGGTTLPTCAIYDGTVITPGRVRASSRIGDRNTFDGLGDVLFPGQSVLVAWSGCTPGATCNAVLRGESQ